MRRSMPFQRLAPLVLAALVTLPGCASRRGTAVTSPTTMGTDAVFRCAGTQLQQLGYTVTRSAADTARVVGERQVMPGWTAREVGTALITLGFMRPDHRPYADVVTVSVMRTENAAMPVVVRVEPTARRAAAEGDSGTASGAASRAAWDDATRIAEACGQAGGAAMVR